MKKFKTIGMLLLFSISLSDVYFEKALAQNWGPGHSSQFQWYEMGGDPTVSHGSENAGFIRSKVSEPGNSGVYMINISSNSYRGKRVRLSAYLKTENVSSWASLWMRVDYRENQKYQMLGFDNMFNRPIIGTTDWQKYEIVLDVPQNSTNIALGILLYVGTGKIWVDGLQLEIVSNDVPVTDLNDFYPHLYYFTEGNYQEIISKFETFFESSPIPQSRIYLYEHLIYYLSLYRDGQAEKADSHILEYSKTLDDVWIAPVVHFYAGKISEDSLLVTANNNGQKCEAYYYAGMKHLFDGDTTKAKARFEACIATGISNYFEYEWAEIELDRLNQPTGVKEIVNTSIEDFELLQNYPNPFNSRTTISYSVPQSGFVELKIYNMLGREIQTVVNEFQAAGKYSFDFDARKLSNGAYFYQLKVGNRFSETKKMLYIK